MNCVEPKGPPFGEAEASKGPSSGKSLAKTFSNETTIPRIRPGSSKKNPQNMFRKNKKQKTWPDRKILTDAFKTLVL